MTMNKKKNLRKIANDNKHTYYGYSHVRTEDFKFSLIFSKCFFPLGI